MIAKRRIVSAICFLLLFCITGSGCSQKKKEAVDSSNSNTKKQEQLEEPTKEPTKEPEEKNVDSVVKEDSSPWKLVSESKVETSVHYAGFLNDSIGVTVGYEGEISFTEDGGKTWLKSTNVSYCRYGLDFYDESFLVSSGNGGVNLVSKDKGKNWSNLSDFPLKNNSFYNKFLSVIDTSNMYIGSLQSLGVSTDGGSSWKELQLPEGCTSLAGMYFITPEVGYLLGSDGILYKTKDSCTSWTSQAIDIAGESIGYASMPTATMNFQDEDHGMLIYKTKTGIYCLKTEDGGMTWDSIEMPKSTCFTPYLSRDGQYLTLSSQSNDVCLYKLE